MGQADKQTHRRLENGERLDLEKYIYDRNTIERQKQLWKILSAERFHFKTEKKEKN